MSIADELYKLECDGKLYRFVPRGRKPPQRRAYLTAHAQKQFDNPNSAVNLLVGQGFVRAALTLWTLGEQVRASKIGKTGGFLKELDPPPDNVWEIRVTHPAPQVRLIGTFAEPDTLVITAIHTRSHLGGKGSAAWIDAMNFCDGTWNSLFDSTPYRANSIHDYVTEKCDAFPLKR